MLGLQAVSALQIPFLPSQLGQVKLSPDSLSGETSKKQLIDTEALQALIKPEKLLHRAKELYEIAKLSEDEYNHPTRVIGSKGKLRKSHS